GETYPKSDLFNKAVPDIHRHHSSAYPARARQGCGELQSRPVEVISSMHNQQRIKYAQEQEHPSH
ncbi:hypothetical protein ACYYHF_004785, partial [Salmonella enterica subsp. enterica serovar Anatum]